MTSFQLRGHPVEAAFLYAELGSHMKDLWKALWANPSGQVMASSSRRKRRHHSSPYDNSSKSSLCTQAPGTAMLSPLKLTYGSCWQPQPWNLAAVQWYQRVACKLFFNRVLIWKHWHGYLHDSVGHMFISVSYDVLILKLEILFLCVCVFIVACVHQHACEGQRTISGVSSFYRMGL